MDVFQKVAPEVAAAFNGLIMSLVASKGIDPKTKQLICIAMKASMGDSMAVRAHIPLAKAAGATKAEVVDAILSVRVGLCPGLIPCLQFFTVLPGNPFFTPSPSRVFVSVIPRLL